MTLFSIDFETALAEPGLQAPPPVCMSVAPEPAAMRSVVHPDIGLPFLLALLEGGHTITGANIAYDLGVAMAARPDMIPAIFEAYDQDRITDVLIRQKLIDIALGEYRHHGKYSLAALSKRLRGIEMAKEDTWRLRYWELAHLPLSEWPEEAIEYSRNDAIATLEIHEIQRDSLTVLDRLCVLEDQYRQTRADFALHLCACWGLRTDAEGTARLRKQCEEGLAEVTDTLLAAGLLKWKTAKGVKKLSRNVRKAQARMMEINPDARLTKTGKAKGIRELKYISVDAEACEDSGDPLLDAYTGYSQLQNLLTGHVVAMEVGLVTPIHPRFEVLLETGRTSASKPNTQNVRRAPGARECYIPREGWCFVSADYAKAELHTLSQVCINLFGRSVLGDVLNAGIDPYIVLGARLAGTSYEDLEVAIKAGDTEAADHRQHGKIGVLGFPGGLGAKGLRASAKSTYGVEMSIGHATRLRDEWSRAYPVVSGDYLNYISQLTRGTGWTTIEHHGSRRWRGKVSYCQAANSFFQGMASDGMKQALWDVTKKCYTPGTALYGCRVVNEIHDELLLEAPIEVASNAAWELRDTMVAAYNQYTVDVPVRAEPCLMDRWSKKARTIVDSSGNLQIWRYGQ